MGSSTIGSADLTSGEATSDGMGDVSHESPLAGWKGSLQCLVNGISGRHNKKTSKCSLFLTDLEIGTVEMEPEPVAELLASHRTPEKFESDEAMMAETIIQREQRDWAYWTFIFVGGALGCILVIATLIEHREVIM
jgi:hypothetical protein